VFAYTHSNTEKKSQKIAKKIKHPHAPSTKTQEQTRAMTTADIMARHSLH